MWSSPTDFQPTFRSPSWQNTLTNLILTIHLAADTVSRELTGLIPAVMRNSSAERAALNETIYFPVVPTYATADIAAAATGPDPSDSTIGNDSMAITASKSVTFHWSGEDQRGLNNAGYYNAILRDQFTQAMRALVNEIEAELAAAYKKASRAHGTAPAPRRSAPLATTATARWSARFSLTTAAR